MSDAQAAANAIVAHALRLQTLTHAVDDPGIRMEVWAECEAMRAPLLDLEMLVAPEAE